MLTVVDKPLIQYAVDEARDAGIEELIFITGRGKTAIEDHFDHAYELQDMLAARGKEEALRLVKETIPAPGQLAFTRQQEPLGLGHARSEERRVGKACGRPCRARGSPYQ